MNATPLQSVPVNQESASAMTQQNNPYAGFDPHAGISWLYPIDSTTPDYLPLITEKALYYNSLVVLPTKFEKSFLSAVTMYNIYRWYPLSKIIYVAAKRDFISEQMASSEILVRFNKNDLAEMVLKPHERLRNWMSKRVFFITSHMLLCDMNRAAENLPMDKVKLIVIDEPQLEGRLHAKILEKLSECNKNFRILCVSTTSSKTIDARMLKQWFISSIELEWGNPLEKPEDWLMNKKEISNISTPIESALSELLDELRDIGQRFTKNLHISKLICKAEFETIDVEMLRQQRDKYERALLTGVLRENHHELMLNFHLAERALVGYQILKQDGIVALLEYFHREIDIFVTSDQKLAAFLDKLRQGLYNTPHPKFHTLENFLREFFQRRPQARVLIVAERMNSAMVINHILERIPLCRHKLLMNGTYMHDVEQFRNGELDVLTVTVAMEPAINLGETELIVLFNATDKPREFLAHIARTRGASPGAIVILTIEGSEQLAVDEVINTRRMYFFENPNILPIGVDLSNMMMQSSPSLIPPGFQPKRREVFFNLKLGTNCETNPVREHGVEYSEKFGQPQAGDKRKVVEVLSDKPAVYDSSSGHTVYEVIPIKQLVVPSSAKPPLSENAGITFCKTE